MIGGFARARLMEGLSVRLTTTVIAILLTIFILSSCTEKALEPRLGDSVKIKYGNTAYIADEGLSIEFSGPVDDSRCPLRLDCLWPGEIKVHFQVQQEGLPLALTNAVRGVSDWTSRPAYYHDYKISVLAVDPYPIETNDIPDEIRVATIRVEKINPGDSSSRDIGFIRFSSNPPEDLRKDAFNLVNASIQDDILTLAVRYGGGCSEHDFYLYMDPPVFMESNPVQANLYLRHDGNGDACDALLSENLKFDIRLMAEIYRHQYSRLDDIILNIYDYSQDSYIPITYSPE